MEEVRAPAGLAAAAADASGATAATRSYLSSQHRWAAKHFARLAAEFEDAHAGECRIFWQHRAYVDAAITESVGFLEAYINEIYSDAADPDVEAGAHDGLPQTAIASIAGYWTQHHETASIETKYRMARVFIAGAPADEGRRPFEDVKLLIQIRNWLIHYKPSTVVGGAPPPRKAWDNLQTRIAPNRIFEGGSLVGWFPYLALSAGAAAWAIESAEAYVHEFITDIGGTRTHHLITAGDETP